MSILKRIRNIFTSKVNSTLDDLENPIELLNQNIIQREEKLKSAQMATAKVFGSAFMSEKAVNEKEQRIKGLEEDIKLAISKEDRDLAKEILLVKKEEEKQLEVLKIQYNSNEKMSQKLQNKISTLEQEVIKLKDYKLQAEARLETAEANIEINKILNNLSDEPIDINNLERKIAEKEALGSGIEKMANQNNIQKRIDSLKISDINYLDEELKKYE